MRRVGVPEELVVPHEDSTALVPAEQEPAEPVASAAPAEEEPAIR